MAGADRIALARARPAPKAIGAGPPISGKAAPGESRTFLAGSGLRPLIDHRPRRAPAPPAKLSFLAFSRWPLAVSA